ncbi:MAG: 4Fe-4S binding protein [Desulfovibrio sp.]|jgi:Fe-S-cluster-containing hydrogenase component 2|nr:4Fe-4S binding protein [Desulfovibrio sp.]
MREKVIMRPDRCKACRRCEVACIAAHHGFDMKEAMKRRSEFGPRVRVVKGENYKTTVRCHECVPAPCVNICPTGALVQDENGVISMHPELCMACEMCMDACPYGAVHLDKVPFPAVDGVETPEGEEPATRTIAVRCDLCRDWRKANGKTMTACMEACPAQAIGILTTDGHTIFPEKNKPKPAAVKQVATKVDVDAAEITNR